MAVAFKGVDVGWGLIMRCSGRSTHVFVVRHVSSHCVVNSTMSRGSTTTIISREKMRDKTAGKTAFIYEAVMRGVLDVASKGNGLNCGNGNY